MVIAPLDHDSPPEVMYGAVHFNERRYYPSVREPLTMPGGFLH